ncbi:SDR family oxidoreductase [Sulfurimonas sp. MAG313]|nr:SDR family oxidoreductase [Sulfurimonas sp. MAG313]MDF1881313.1 SDR family oxidoreductase [Sulfurimonas sp. MAG313]
MNKVALITGSSSGIGQAIKDTLLSMGYRVYGLARRTQVKEKNFVPLVCDISDAVQLEKSIQILLKETDINLLINSAGLGYFEPHEELSVTQIKEIIDTNLTAPILLTSLCLRSLKKTKGKVINISSIEALKASKFSAVYSASKAGLHHFGSSLFEEVRKSGVQIVSIHPDLTQTSFFDNLHFKPKDNEMMSLKPEDIAQSVQDILNMREGVSITEVTIRPQYFGISKKS